jgi:hypothetical protein
MGKCFRSRLFFFLNDFEINQLFGDYSDDTP